LNGNHLRGPEGPLFHGVANIQDFDDISGVSANSKVVPFPLSGGVGFSAGPEVMPFLKNRL
jgi:hypothetical protein